MRLSYQRSSSKAVSASWIQECRQSRVQETNALTELGKGSGQRVRVVGESQGPKRLHLNIGPHLTNVWRQVLPGSLLPPQDMGIYPLFERIPPTSVMVHCVPGSVQALCKGLQPFLSSCRSTEMRSESLVQDHRPRDPQSALNAGSAQHPQYGNGAWLPPCPPHLPFALMSDSWVKRAITCTVRYASHGYY